MPTIDDLLAQEREEELYTVRDVPKFRTALEALAARYRGKVVHFGLTRATTSFPSVFFAKNFLEAAQGRFKVNRVGAEVRVHWTLHDPDRDRHNQAAARDDGWPDP